ncbi:hypothetical protein DPEC_G00338540 [Dallia pectoralis]|uniref:Uncharacterized protein n=1 Tax=Dallia pectoralis TaxID=75939 RepID=A0ACC2F4Q5_DALPE|nr:hypothetical protein DPEC_G00338540 [Dallia pectoralis]
MSRWFSQNRTPSRVLDHTGFFCSGLQTRGPSPSQPSNCCAGLGLWLMFTIWLCRRVQGLGRAQPSPDSTRVPRIHESASTQPPHSSLRGGPWSGEKGAGKSPGTLGCRAQGRGRNSCLRVVLHLSG